MALYVRCRRCRVEKRDPTYTFREKKLPSAQQLYRSGHEMLLLSVGKMPDKREYICGGSDLHPFRFYTPPSKLNGRQNQRGLGLVWQS